MIPENHRYIRGKLEPICEYLLDALRLTPDTESQRQIIKCFAYIGFIADREFKRFLLPLKLFNFFFPSLCIIIK